jgi:hypothetical protein
MFDSAPESVLEAWQSGRQPIYDSTAIEVSRLLDPSTVAQNTKIGHAMHSRFSELKFPA